MKSKDNDDVGANGPRGDESGSPGEQAPLSPDPLPPPTRVRMREPSPVCLATKKDKSSEATSPGPFYAILSSSYRSVNDGSLTSWAL